MDEEQRMKHNYKQIVIALAESVRLQAHYAEILNMHDDGMRKIFRSSAEWIDRLVGNGTIQPLKGENE